MIGTAHFRPSEFQCPHCHVVVVRRLLLERLERARSLAGGHPIRIVSGYRCPVHNKAVGGAPDSQHMYGAAADVPERHFSPAVALRAGFTGLGVKDGWVTHVDIRDGPPVRWTYPPSSGAH